MGVSMFEPNFNYDDKIVKNLTFISKSQGIIMSVPYIPNWEVSLRKEAILRSAHSSTAIEGNPLTMEEVSALANGRDIMAKRKDKEEVLNYLETLDKIPEFGSRDPFTLNDLLEIHKVLTKNTLNNPEDEGILRNRQVHVVNSNGKTVFMPPQTDEVPVLIEDFLKWFNSSDLNEMDPVIIAGITHYELVRIHPFIDGNGRTARIMATLILYKRGFDLKRFFVLDDYYDQDRPSYYAVLKSIDQNTLDLTGWLEYFTEGVAVSIKTVKEKVIGLNNSFKLLEEKGQIAFDDKQIAIVERIVSKGQTTNSDIRSILGLGKTAVKNEFTKLVELGVINRIRKGRSTYYILANGRIVTE
jgi:Fic family protein